MVMVMVMVDDDGDSDGDDHDHHNHQKTAFVLCLRFRKPYIVRPNSGTYNHTY